MWFELTSDIRTAFRGFSRAPGTSALIVFTLAFAIAAATIGFSVADLALFRGLPVDDNSKVVSLFVSDTHGSNFRARVSAPDLLDYRARSTTLDQLSAAGVKRISVGGAMSRVALAAFLKCAHEMKDQGSFSFVKGMAPIKDLREGFAKV